MTPDDGPAAEPGEQYLFPEDIEEPVETKAPAEPEEDLGIPAFLRRRMRKNS
jgi:hypothetical protein